MSVMKSKYNKPAFKLSKDNLISFKILFKYLIETDKVNKCSNNSFYINWLNITYNSHRSIKLYKINTDRLLKN